MPVRSKRYREARDKVDRGRRYGIQEALGLLKSLPRARFNETVEVSLRLGIDPRQSDQIVRGSVTLPKGTGRDVKVVAFCTGSIAEEAKAAGAIEAGGEELVEKIQGGWTNFDVAVASPEMMRLVGRLGRILGPQGKMPSPRTGTVTEDVTSAVREFRAGRIEYRSDSTGNIHAPVGKVDFSDEALHENVQTFIEHIRASRPPAVKGTFILGVSLTSSMGPGIPLSV